jgi:hypothetical protein
MSRKATAKESLAQHVASGSDGFVEVTWEGHIDATSVGVVSAHLERYADAAPELFVVMDTRGITGYEPDAYAYAHAWSMTAAPRAIVVAAIVAESTLAAAESPATALMPARRVRLFASLSAAREYVKRFVPARSGEYRVPQTLPGHGPNDE